MLYDEGFGQQRRRCSNCGNTVKAEHRYCAQCGHLCDVNGWEECGRDRCGNCHELLQEGDAYCRICGTKAGEGKFEPFRNLMECIYGPMPIDRFHSCRSCGHSWKTRLMIDKQKYCPRCGGNDVEIKSDEPTIDLNKIDGFNFGTFIAEE